VKIRTKTVVLLFALLVVFVSGCVGEEKKIPPNEPGNISDYEFEVFLNESNNQTPANTTTYYPLDNKKTVQVVNLVINTSELKVYPPEILGGNQPENPIQNFVQIVGSTNKTAATEQTFKELSSRNNTSDLNYTINQKISQSMRVINLKFNEPVTGFIAYSLEIPGTQNFAFMKPDSEFFRVVLPEGYVTGNRVFGIARPTPFNVTFDEKGRQTLLWISSQMGEREEVIQVKYYTESAPLYFLAAIVVLLFGVGLVLSNYARSKKELEAVREILDLEKEYDKQKRKLK
jgi:hypothetical protein